MPAIQDTVTFDSLLTSTLNNVRPILYDAIFKDSAFWSKLHLNGRKQMEDGGARIQRSVEYALNGTAGSFNGYDEIDLTPQDTNTVSLWDWKENAVSIVISRREERINSGKAAIHNLLTSKINNATASFSEFLSKSVLNPDDFSTPDNGGDSLTPLTQLIPLAANEVGGIDATATGQDWWDVKRKLSLSNGGGARTYVQHKGDLRTFYNEVGKGTGGFADMVLSTQLAYEKYEESLEGQVRYGSTEMADLGFETIRLKGAEVMWDEIAPGTTAGGAAYAAFDSGAPEEAMFFLNSDYISLIVDSQTDMVNRDFMDSDNQTAKSALVLFMAELICTNRRKQGVFYGIDTATITG